MIRVSRLTHDHNASHLLQEQSFLRFTDGGRRHDRHTSGHGRMELGLHQYVNPEAKRMLLGLLVPVGDTTLSMLTKKC